MRKDASSHFMIGLFVLIGVSIGFVFVFWLGVSRYSQTGETYAAYFDESVQGLQADSSVKYRGVDVGRVEKIRVAPDNRLIEWGHENRPQGRSGKNDGGHAEGGGHHGNRVRRAEPQGPGKTGSFP
jgi:hypothetical protein